jgi:transposase
VAITKSRSLNSEKFVRLPGCTEGSRAVDAHLAIEKHALTIKWDLAETSLARELYQLSEIVTRLGFPSRRESDSGWRTKEVRHVGSYTPAWGFQRRPAPRACEEDQRRPAGAKASGSAVIYDGGTRIEAAKLGGVGLQIVRDWVVRFNTRGPDGLLDGKWPGQPSKLNNAQRQTVARMIEIGPIPAVHGVVRWPLIDLALWIFEEFRITIAKQTLSRELRSMGCRKLSSRHHAQAVGAIEDFKKTPTRAWTKSRTKRRSTSRP